MRMLLRARPRPHTAQAVGTLLERNAPENAPADMSVTVTDDDILVRDADRRGEREHLLNGACGLHRLQVEIALLRQEREPAGEPAAMRFGLNAVEKTLSSGSHHQGAAGSAAYA